MNRITIKELLLSASTLLLCGCGSSDDSSSNSTQKKANAVENKHKAPIFHLDTAKSNNGEAMDALSGANFTSPDHMQRAIDGQKHLGSQNRAAHSSQHTELPKATEGNPVFFEMVNHPDTTKKTLTHIKRAGHLTGLYMENVNVSMEKGGRMDTMVASAKNSDIITNKDAPFTTHAFYLGETASVAGNDEIHYINTPDMRFGMTLENVRGAVPSRYDNKEFSAAKGEFVIKGTMTRQSIPKGMTLRAFGRKTRIDNLTQNGGILEVRGSSSLRVQNYTVTDASPFEFFWDTHFDDPRFVIEGRLTMRAALGIRLAVDARVIKQGEEAVVIKFDPNNVDLGGKEIHKLFEAGVNKFGASFDGGPNAKTGEVTLKVTNVGTYKSNTSDLNDSTQQLAADIMNSGTQLGSDLMIAEIDDARTALTQSTSESLLMPQDNWTMPDFSTLHVGTSACSSWVQTHQTANTTLSAIGGAFAENTHAGLSLTKQIHTDQPTTALHISKNKSMLSVFGNEKTLGGQLNKKIGVFNVGVTHACAERSGSYQTKLWNIAIQRGFHQQTTTHLGINTTIPQLGKKPINIGVKALFDIYKHLADHTAYINETPFEIKGYDLSKGVGFQLNTTIPFTCGHLAFSYDGYRANQRLLSSVALNFQFEY